MVSSIGFVKDSDVMQIGQMNSSFLRLTDDGLQLIDLTNYVGGKQVDNTASLPMITVSSKSVTAYCSTFISQKVFAMGHLDGTVEICYLDQEQKVCSVFQQQLHSGKVIDIQFSTFGRFILSASEDKTIHVLQIEGGMIHSLGQFDYQGTFYAIRFDEDLSVIDSKQVIQNIS
jgi:WD40 repeat protein